MCLTIGMANGDWLWFCFGRVSTAWFELCVCLAFRKHWKHVSIRRAHISTNRSNLWMHFNRSDKTTSLLSCSVASSHLQERQGTRLSEIGLWKMCQCKFRAALCRIKSRPLTSVRASELLVTSSYLSNARQRSLDIIKIRATHWIKDNSLFHIASPAIYGLMQRLLSILLLRLRSKCLWDFRLIPFICTRNGLSSVGLIKKFIAEFIIR